MLMDGTAACPHECLGLLRENSRAPAVLLLVSRGVPINPTVEQPKRKLR